MLAITETAMPGIGLSIPAVIEREAVPYLAIRASGPMRELVRFAPPVFHRLHGWMREHGVAGRDGFFRYRRFGADGTVELDVGTTTAAAASGGGEVIADMLPAGRYAAATYAGPYDRLYDAFAMLNGWMAARGLAAARAGGEIGCQVEIYRVSPAQTEDASKWETDILVLLERERKP
ncbi:MAG: DNA gyrase inhibitor [Alphaproteobacteria bacterium]|nr:MAG: DNA gyrase inhibitor [Alphaproteobacteria bacterium]